MDSFEFLMANDAPDAVCRVCRQITEKLEDRITTNGVLWIVKHDGS